MIQTVRIKGTAAGDADFSYTLDRVLAVLLDALKAGRVQEAVDVYLRCNADIAFALIARAQAHPDVLRALTNLFFRARDYARAAYCCEQLDEPLKAAALYERCDDYHQAAQMYASAGETLHAAEMFEKDKCHLDAAQLFVQLHMPQRAATCLQRAGRFLEAAQQYQLARKPADALEALKGIATDSAEFNAARALAAQLHADVAAPTTASEAPPADHEGFAFLHALPLFATLTLPQLRQLHALCTCRDVACDQVVIAAGAVAPALFVLLTGRLVVLQDPSGVQLSTINPGEHVGEMGLFDDAPANVVVMAAADSRVLVLERAGFSQLLAHHDALALRIHRVFLQQLIARLRHTTQRVTS